jgi:hypothetical protein
MQQPDDVDVVGLGLGPPRHLLQQEDGAAAGELGLGTTAAMIFFATNALLWVVFQVLVWRGCGRPSSEAALGAEAAADSKAGGKSAAAAAHNAALSKPFTGDVDSFLGLTRDLGITGLVMLLTYVCEKHPIFPHSTKTYDKDLFLLICFVFFAYAWYVPTRVRVYNHWVIQSSRGRGGFAVCARARLHSAPLVQARSCCEW